MPGEANADLLVGRTIAGKYVIESFLGGGAMGSVYRSRQVALDKTVAIKVMRPDLASDPSFIGRFRREAKAASKLSHPSSINVTDFGEEPDGLLYIVMEHVAGRDLESMIQESTTPLPDERIAGILSQVLSAVAVAHDLGIVHRDLKPANILIVPEVDDEGRQIDVVKVCDFGIASMRGSDAETPPPVLASRPPYTRRDSGKKLTAIGALLGTPEYMSPEQASGLTLDPASDQYSIGAILFELLTLRTVYVADSPEKMVLEQALGTPPHPRTVRLCNENLAAVCMRALAKKPNDRYPSARAMRAELRAAIGEVSRESSPNHPPRTTHTGLSIPTPTDAILAAAAATSSLPPHRVPVVDKDSPTIADRVPVAPPPSKKWVIGFGLLAAMGFALGGYALLFRHARPVVVAASSAASAVVVTAPVVGTTPPNVTSADVIELPDTPSPSRSGTTVASAVAPKSDKNADKNAEKSGDKTAEKNAPVVAVEAPVVTAPVVTSEPAPPPATAVVVAPPPVVAPTPQPVAPPFDPSAARVSAAVVSAARTSRATMMSVVSHASFDGCYRDALRALGRAEGGVGTAHVEVDEDGIISSVSVKLPTAVSSANGCFAAKLRGQRVGIPDTGHATADLSFTLIPN